MQAQYMQLKWTQLEADAPFILTKDQATCFAASDKLHALGCSTGTVHVLDFEGNKIRELEKHKSRVTGIALSSNMEAVATGSEDGAIRVQPVAETVGAWQSSVAGTISCLAVPPTSTDRIDEVAVGYEPGILSIVRRTWLPLGSEQVVRRHESKVHHVLWLESAIVWATDAGVAACQVNGRAPCAPLPKPHNAGALACSLASVTADIVLVAWPHAVQVVSLERPQGRLPGTVTLAALQTFSVQYRLHGIAPFGKNVALLADVSPAACRPMPSNLHEEPSSPGRLPAADPEPQEASGGQQGATEPPTAAPPPKDPPSDDSSSKSEAGSTVSPPPAAAQSEPDSHPHPAHPDAVAAESPKEKNAAKPGALEPGTDSQEGSGEEDSPRSPMVLGTPPGRERDDAGSSARPPPQLQLPLEAARSPDQALHTAADVAEDDGGKSGLRLLVLTTSGDELASDDLGVEYDGRVPVRCLDVQRQHAGPPGVCMLTFWYPEQYGVLMQAHLPDTPATPRTPRTAQKEPPTPSPPPQKPPSTPEAEAAAAAATAVAAPDKWWQDCDEPLFLVVTSGAVVVGRPCDADDQVLYLLGQGNYAAAMLVATDAPYVRAETMEECRSAYLKHLLDSGNAAGAARWATEHLGKDKGAWERLVFMCAQREQLPALGKHVPVSPRLSQLAYTAVAAAYVPQEQHHAELAALLHRWPQALLNDIAEEVTQIISHRIHHSPGAPSVDIQRALARLLQVQKDHKGALDIWLSIADPCVFDHIHHHPELYEAAGRGAAQLMVVNAERAIRMLVEHHDKVDANDVIARVRARLDSAPAHEIPEWRQRLCRYMHALFMVDRRAPHSFHDLQVELYAECQPEQLLPFLQSSKQFNKEAALEVCRERQLVREQVFVLGRLSRASEALQLIISTLHDLPQAIAFVSGHPELWDELLSLVVKDPELTGQLLDQVGGEVDPVRVIEAIPDDLEIPNLGQRLSALLSRFHATVRLKKLCNGIIDADCIAVAERLMKRSQEPLRHVHMWDPKTDTWELLDTVACTSQPCDPPVVPPDAIRYCPPTHTHNLSMRAQVGAHMSAALDALQVGEGGTLNVDGMHAMVEHEVQQLVRQEAAAVLQAPQTGGLTIWYTEM